MGKLKLQGYLKKVVRDRTQFEKIVKQKIWFTRASLSCQKIAIIGTYPPAPLRRQIIERAGDRCEYCRFPQSVALLAFFVSTLLINSGKEGYDAYSVFTLELFEVSK